MTELFRKQFLVIISEKIFPWDVWYHFRIIWEWFAARNKNVFNSIFINLPKNALKCVSSNFDCFFECEFSKKIINKLWMKKWENCLIISTAKEMNLSLYLRWEPKKRTEILSKWMTVIKNIFKVYTVYLAQPQLVQVICSFLWHIFGCIKLLRNLTKLLFFV